LLLDGDMNFRDKLLNPIAGIMLGMAMSLIVFVVERRLKKTLRQQESRRGPKEAN
jgi:hypothetical protein